jgi:hypothetical protein
MPDSFQLSVEEIDNILASPDAFAAERLMQRYETTHDKTAFVAALIGQVLLLKARAARNPLPLILPAREHPPIY